MNSCVAQHFLTYKQLSQAKSSLVMVDKLVNTE